jgi:hypothetical protein
MKVVADRGASLVARDSICGESWSPRSRIGWVGENLNGAVTNKPFAAKLSGMAARGFSGGQISVCAPEI